VARQCGSAGLGGRRIDRFWHERVYHNIDEWTTDPSGSPPCNIPTNLDALHKSLTYEGIKSEDGPILGRKLEQLNIGNDE
jgi:hypothetical protein